MTKISDADFEIALKIAARMSMDDEVAFFNNLDVSNVFISEKARKRFQRMLVWEKTKKFRNTCLTMCKRVAVVGLAICTFLFTIAMSIEPVRAAFRDAIITWYEDYIGIRYMDEDQNVPTTIETVVLPDNLPDSWRWEITVDSPMLKMYDIWGPSGEYLTYQQIILDYEEQWIDNSGCILEEIEFNNNKDKVYLAIYDECTYRMVWKGEYVFLLQGENISKDSFISIAENIGK